MTNSQEQKMFFNAQHAENILIGHGVPVEERQMWALSADEVRQKIDSIFQGKIDPEIIPSDKEGIAAVIFTLENLKLLLEPEVVEGRKQITPGNVQTFLNIEQQLFQFTLTDEGIVNEEEMSTVEDNLQILLEIFPMIIKIKEDIETGLAQDSLPVGWYGYNFTRVYESL